MNYEPVVIKPQTASGPAKHPNEENNHHTTPKPITPDAALALTLVELQKSQSIADRLPDLKKSAYIFIGLILFSAVQALAMHSIMISVLGTQSHNSPASATYTSAVVWILGLAGSIVTLTTKNTKTVKIVLWIVGICVAYSLVAALSHADIIGAGIDGFILWWTYNLYQSVEVIEM